MGGLRGVRRFWAALLVLAVGGAITLQVMGPLAPPPAPAIASAAPVAPAAVGAAIPASLSVPSKAPAAAPPGSTNAWPGPPIPPPADGIIRAPDQALLEPAPDFNGRSLPRIATDGRTSLRAYARSADPADKRPKVALLIVGLGLADADSRAAIDALPGAVTLGFSPYTPNPDPLLSAARAHGHEYLVSLPMESQGYPLNDSGPHALLTGADPAVNERNLEWTLSRMQGEVGLTGASDGLRGERFASAAALFSVVRGEIAQRGLLYVDSRPGAVTHGAQAVTAVVDDPANRGDIDAKLAELEQHARDTGTALGLAGPLRPVTVERIAAWAHGLAARGIDLVPVSALPLPQRDVQ
jgi:uncharacterized protein